MVLSYFKENNYSFQKSRYLNQFTINIGIYLSDFEYYFFDQPKVSNEKFDETICAIRNRIGKLKNIEENFWYDLDENENLFQEIDNDIKNKITPYCNKFINKKYILKQLFMSRYYGFYEVARIKTGLKMIL